MSTTCPATNSTPSSEPGAEFLDRSFETDCLELLPKLPDGSVDLVLCDLPYGTTRNRWDSVLPMDELWSHYWRILKPNGVVALTAAQPFTSILVCSNLDDFKVEWIWEKTIGSGQLNIRHQPLKTHESVVVFYRGRPTYNPQMTVGTPYSVKRKGAESQGYNAQRDVSVVNTGTRYPTTVQRVSNPRIKGGHPTQKPQRLMEYFIETYSEPGDVVLDHCLGSGTTAAAAIATGRRFIGVENDPEYASAARLRIADCLALAQPGPNDPE